LMKASGAGAGAQNVMGTGVFFGMLVATALGVFIIPGNFTFIEGLGRRRKREQPSMPIGADAEHPAPAMLAVDASNGDHAAPAAMPAKAGGEH